ncbi:MAG: pilus assembly protein N-terminal domain-containing protein [Prevotella bivia]|nr:pilus assembly protein N-terminal domain-containing protein [Prevotella bivia]
MKTKNLSKWLILLLCACVVTFYSCDKVDYDQKDSKEMKKQEEKKKQEEEKKKQEEEKKKQEEEKKKQEEEKKKQEEEKKKQEEEKKKQEEEKKKQEEAEARRKKEEEEKKKQLTLDPTSLTLKPFLSKNVYIKNGTAPYKVEVTNKGIASVTVHEKDNFIVVIAVQEGTTEIVVTDKNGKTGTVKVTTSNH